MKRDLCVSRRAFLGVSGAAVTAGIAAAGYPAETAAPSGAKLPKWHGFNLLEKFMMPQNGRFVENDFAGMSELGFDFARLPMDYRCWTDPNDWTKLREEVLKEIDEAVSLGEKHRIHVCMNFHRAPGFTVAEPPERKELWSDDEALKVCALHWARFAERYAGIPNERLSFNLFNEPTLVSGPVHRRVVAHVLEEIRKHDTTRLVICDGRFWGRMPPEELLGLGVAAATRGYDPMPLTHYKAEWVKDADKYDVPTYPLKEGDKLWNENYLREHLITPWKALEAKGMGVMVGEFGAYNKTPHPVVLSWMRDCLDLWKEAGWGWAMWNYRGGFGIVNSDRPDVVYRDFHGYKLDSAMFSALKSAM